MLTFDVTAEVIIALVSRIAFLSGLVYVSLGWFFDSDFYAEWISGYKEQWRDMDANKQGGSLLHFFGAFLLSKSTWAFAYSLLLCMGMGFDFIAGLQDLPDNTLTGEFLSAGVLAGGSRGILKLAGIAKGRVDAA